MCTSESKALYSLGRKDRGCASCGRAASSRALEVLNHPEAGDNRLSLAGHRYIQLSGPMKYQKGGVLCVPAVAVPLSTA